MDPLLRKGHAHKPRSNEPDVCPDCWGTGILENGSECLTCGGTGEIYE